MKTKIIQEKVFTTKTVEAGTKDVTIYVSDDGKEFRTKEDCDNHEKITSNIENGKDQFMEVDLDSDLSKKLVEICFDGYDVSSVGLFAWKATKDKEKIKKAISYLIAKCCGNVYSDMFDDIPVTDEGTVYIIATWSESESSDYPSFFTKAIKMNTAFTMMDKMVSDIKQSILKF